MPTNNWPQNQPTVVDNDNDGLRLKQNYGDGVTPPTKNPGVDYFEDWNGIIEMLVRICYAIGSGQTPTVPVTINSPASGKSLSFDVVDQPDSILERLGDLEDTAVVEVVAGTNVSVDNTDPKRPVISATGGGGGSPDIQDEGSVVVGSPAAINFVGAGVTVTEDPSGVAKVTIPGGGGGGITLGEVLGRFAEKHFAFNGDPSSPDNIATATIAITDLGGGVYEGTVSGAEVGDVLAAGDVIQLTSDFNPYQSLYVISLDSSTTFTAINTGVTPSAGPDTFRRWRGRVMTIGKQLFGPMLLGKVSLFFIRSYNTSEDMLVFWTGNNAPGWIPKLNGTPGGFAGPASPPDACGWVMKKNDSSVYMVCGVDAAGDLILRPLVPPGGAAGQVLTKASGDDWDTYWA